MTVLWFVPDFPDHRLRHDNAPFIPNLLGAVNLGLGRSEKAVASYTKAQQVGPDYGQANNNPGNVLDDFGKPEEAGTIEPGK